VVTDYNIVSDDKYYWIIGGLTLIALILRFYNLGFNSLWLDEATTSMISSKSFMQIWETTVSGEFNPPLFYWIEHVMLAFGNSEFVLRFIPALLGTATIPMVYYAGKEFLDRNVGLIAASAFTFSPFLIVYSQEARAYSSMLFFITAATIFYLIALRTNNLKNWIIFGILSAIAFWCHFYAMVIVVSYVIYAIMIYIKEIRKDANYAKPLLAMIGTFSVLSLPLILVTIQLFGLRTSSAPSFGIKGIDVVIETFRQVSGFSDIIMGLFIVLFCVGLFRAYFIGDNKFTFLLWVTSSIFIISYVLSFIIPMVPRYLQFLNIVFFIGIATSYRVFATLLNNKNVVYLMMFIFFIISVPFFMTYYTVETKDNWRDFSTSVSQITKNGDYVVYVPMYMQTPMEYYYSNKTDGTITYGAYNMNDLMKIQKNNNSVYYIVTPDISSTDPTGNAIKWFDNNANLIGRDGNIFLFKGM